MIPLDLGELANDNEGLISCLHAINLVTVSEITVLFGLSCALQEEMELIIEVEEQELNCPGNKEPRLLVSLILDHPPASCGKYLYQFS